MNKGGHIFSHGKLDGGFGQRQWKLKACRDCYKSYPPDWLIGDLLIGLANYVIGYNKHAWWAELSGVVRDFLGSFQLNMLHFWKNGIPKPMYVYERKGNYSISNTYLSLAINCENYRH